ncbi:MAG: hypothetical protein FK734_15350 [Asgard group archaeon]|nr:hypothetical protein [Asgard group archaeon]
MAYTVKKRIVAREYGRNKRIIGGGSSGSFSISGSGGGGSSGLPYEYDAENDVYIIAKGVYFEGNVLAQGEVLAFTGEIESNWWDSMPIASDTVLGGIKVGANLTIDENGVLNAQAGGEGSGVWGSISGTLSDQTDLLNSLNAKEDLITKSTGYAKWTGSAWSFVNETYSLSTHNHSGTYEPVFTKNTAFNKNFAGTGSASTISRSDHNHDSTYEPVFTKNTAFNKNFAGTGSATTISRSDHNHSGTYEPVFTKNTAFNKNFAGTGSASTVSRSDHNHDTTYLAILDFSDMFELVPNSGNPYIRAKYNFTGDGEIMAYGDSGQLPASIWDSLPIASSSSLGGIKVGDNLTIEADGTLNAQTGGGGITSFSEIEGDPYDCANLETALDNKEGLITKSTGYAKWTGSSWGFVNETYSLSSHSHAFGAITSKPTTISGYGITDAYTKTNMQTSGQSQLHWNNLTNKPTTFTPSTHTHTISQITDISSASVDNSSKLGGLASTAFMRANLYNSYYGLQDPTGSTSNWIRTTSNGILPYASGGSSSLGTASWPFSNVYANNIYDGGTLLENKYLGITAKASDSNLLDGYDSTTFPRKAEAATVTGSWSFNQPPKMGIVYNTNGGYSTYPYTGFVHFSNDKDGFMVKHYHNTDNDYTYKTLVLDTIGHVRTAVARHTSATPVAEDFIYLTNIFDNNSDLIPSVTNTYDIGSPTNTFQYGYFGSKIFISNQWQIGFEGTNLIFYNSSGVKKAKVDQSGNLTAVGDVTAYGTV